MIKSIKDDFSLMASLLIPVAVAVNFTGFGLVKLLGLPIFLDSIGTVFISLIAGPWVGIVTAVITSLITGSFSPEFLPFMPVAIIMALCTGLLGKIKMKSFVTKTIICAIQLMIIAVVVSAPIIVKVYGGNTGNASAGITAFFLATGQNIWTAVFSANIVYESIDKIITAIAAMAIIKSMSSRYLVKFKYGENYINTEEK